MPELFIELFSEEIPARMQKRAEEDLARLLRDKFLVGTGHADLEVRTFSGPRRLGAVVEGVKQQTDEPIQTRKGPKVGAPRQAIDGFLKATGLRSIDEARIEGEPGKEFYVATYKRSALLTVDVLKLAIAEIIRQFPWPKSMRSGSSDLQWVRPLHNICCVFDGRGVKIDVAGIPSEAATWGHRFHAPAKIAVTSFDRYVSDLRNAKVEPFREDRKRMINEQALRLCEERKVEWISDFGLLDEVAGLVEWPVVLLGDMDPAFLDLPGGVIKLSMRIHQKYFAVLDPKTKWLAPHFITVANIDAKDGGKAIAAGNRRVLSARLNDARFFWDADKKTPLYTEERKAKLQKIVFHQKLGSVWDKVERVRALAVELCTVTGANTEQVMRAADLCKMDLVTETVGEFPELQGQIGRELAQLNPLPLEGGGAGVGVNASSTARQGSPRPPTPSPSRGGGEDSVAIAIEDHYRPLGPSDRVPTDPVAVTLALADKLDTLVGFWAIDEKPTGSSDPYALRRAALGLVRLITTQCVRVRLFEDVVGGHWPNTVARVAHSITTVRAAGIIDPVRSSLPGIVQRAGQANVAAALAEQIGPADISRAVMTNLRDLPAFLADRLKVQLRDQGKRHDLVDAVFALGDDDLVRIVARVEALDAFLKTEDGKNLLAGYKRAANILAAEDKKGKGLTAADINAGLNASKLAEPAEKALYDALEAAIPRARAAVEKEDFAAAMKALSGLRAPVDAFFEKVLVNDPQEQLRCNRLLLLARLVEATSAVADFSKIEG